MRHCIADTQTAAARERISRRTAAMAATQGVYSSVNVRKLNAVRGVKNADNAGPRSAMLVPVRTASVLTTASLAVKPVISAVDTRQSLKPSGANSGAIRRPSAASRLWALSDTTLRRRSNVCKNQMTIVAVKMIVNARTMKSLALSHISSSTERSEGKR